MKTRYYKRNVITHGDSIKHYPGGTSILMDMIWRGIKYQIIKRKRKNG